MEAPTSANRQAAILRRESDPGGADLPAGYEGRENGNSGTPEEEEQEGLEPGYGPRRRRAR